MERSNKLRELHLVAGIVCARLLSPPSIEASLVDHMRGLPNHVERVVAESAYQGGIMDLRQMVSHFVEIDAAIIAKATSSTRVTRSWTSSKRGPPPCLVDHEPEMPSPS